MSIAPDPEDIFFVEPMHEPVVLVEEVPPAKLFALKTAHDSRSRFLPMVKIVVTACMLLIFAGGFARPSLARIAPIRGKAARMRMRAQPLHHHQSLKIRLNPQPRPNHRKKIRRPFPILQRQPSSRKNHKRSWKSGQ